MNTNYPDFPKYLNLADEWLKAATNKNQDSQTKHDLIETTIRFTSRIKNVDKSIPHEEISHICDRILGDFNKLSSENQHQIAKYVATMGETGYEHLYQLFQVIGDTQHLPNYLDPQQITPRSLLDTVVNSSLKIFATSKTLPENIINLGVKARKFVDLSKENPIYFSRSDGGIKLEESIQDQILSYLPPSSIKRFDQTSKKRIAQRINEQDPTLNLSKLGINSIIDLIEYLKDECIHVKYLNNGIFSETLNQIMIGKAIPRKTLPRIQKAFPNLQELQICNLDDHAPKNLKNFKFLRNLTITNSPGLTDKDFLLNCASLQQLYLSKVNFKQLDARSLTNLSEIKILTCPKLKNIDNHKNLTSLSTVLISECPNLDLNFLKDIPSLKKISIIDMKDANISSLANHPRVQHLYVANSNIENLDFLFTMPALKLLECPSLEIPQEKIDELEKKGITLNP